MSGVSKSGGAGTSAGSSASSRPANGSSSASAKTSNDAKASTSPQQKAKDGLSLSAEASAKTGAKQPEACKGFLNSLAGSLGIGSCEDQTKASATQERERRAEIQKELAAADKADQQKVSELFGGTAPTLPETSGPAATPEQIQQTKAELDAANAADAAQKRQLESQITRAIFERMGLP